MMYKLNKKLSATIAMASLLALSACSNQEAATNSDEVITLRFSHFMTLNDSMNKEAFEPWARQVEEDSNGRIKVEIYPSATLSKPDVTYDAAAKGTIDIGVQPHGYTSGRFPVSQIAELPGVSESGEQLSCVLHTLYDDGVISNEYADTHLLFMMGSGPHGIHTVDTPIRTPADLKGMRIRRTSSVAADMLESVGAVTVGMPASDTYTSLQRGVIDGVSLPWQPIQAFRLDELVNSHTYIPFYNAAFVVTMNKDKYESLPDDLKKVIDDNSGAQMGIKASQIFDRVNAEVRQAAVDKGDTMVEIPDPLNDPAWKAPLEAGMQKYLSSVNVEGVDTQEVYEKAKAAGAACKV
ncbi:TRAP transporter substrate-binding protein [Psychrobacter sp. H8-1]|uniref:TRAP transporter substrate-binding protein n=1 Tax=Psychrobacter sp. H8-1 TaxID=2774129 RepID=UPI001D11BF67|nr:TRAP transporter substrate-binding protein [Psychrobacter sp. H8-1]